MLKMTDKISSMQLRKWTCPGVSGSISEFSFLCVPLLLISDLTTYILNSSGLQSYLTLNGA